MFKKAILPFALILASGTASAGIVTNETQLLSGDGHEQLAQWYGSDFDLTRIFAKGVDGHTSYDWHASVDNQGPTFTVMELFDNETGDRRVIGGYNAVSWHSNNGYSAGELNFLFNLTSSTIFEATNKSTVYGANNKGMFGASFGGGADLHVRSDLTSVKSTIGFSYGESGRYYDTNYHKELAGDYGDFTIGNYETFIISGSTGYFGTGANALVSESGAVNETNDVPVSFILGGLGLIGIAGARKRHR